MVQGLHNLPCLMEPRFCLLPENCQEEIRVINVLPQDHVARLKVAPKEQKVLEWLSQSLNLKLLEMLWHDLISLSSSVSDCFFSQKKMK